MFYFPIPEGEWSVEISAEGYQATSSTTDPNKGYVDGLIAYDDSNEGWNIGMGNNVVISNNKADNTWKYGHPDLEINTCHFKQRQCLERDGIISFHVKTTGPSATVFVVAPPVQKLSKYNYAVSYGAWTERDMEIGLITVTLDEKRNSGSARKQILRSGLSKAATIKLAEPPEMENFGLQTSETPLIPDIDPDTVEKDYKPPLTPASVEMENSKPATVPHVSDSEDEDTIDIGLRRLGGQRLILHDDIRDVPDPDTADAILNSAHIIHDPWSEVNKFREAAKKPPKGPSSVASGSLAGGSLRGSLKPRSATSEPENKTYVEREYDKSIRRARRRFL